MTYARSASVYDAIYTDMKDYYREAVRLSDLITMYCASGGDHVLNVACGTGLHDQYLTEWFQLEGIDIDPSMLAIARERLPDVPYRLGDMTNFEMGKCYDVVTCLFSAIGHVATLQQMHKAISEMAKHLKPGGILIVEPSIHPDAFLPGHISVNHVQRDGLTIARVGRSFRSGHILRLSMDHFVSRNGEYEDPFTETHDVAMYTIEEYMDAFRAAGLEVYRDPDGLVGRGLFIGCKPL